MVNKISYEVIEENLGKDSMSLDGSAAGKKHADCGKFGKYFPEKLNEDKTFRAGDEFACAKITQIRDLSIYEIIYLYAVMIGSSFLYFIIFEIFNDYMLTAMFWQIWILLNCYFYKKFMKCDFAV